MRKSMTLEEFAKKAGVILVECKSNGGKLAYTTVDYPNFSVVGFRTANGAYTNWLESTFGKQTSKAVLSLLTKG